MFIYQIIDELEKLAPPAYQESYDNSGLIVGDTQKECTGIIVSLDTTMAVLQEAIKKGYNLIISHHPILFNPIKKIQGKTENEKVLIEAIKNDIAIYAIHTNLDNVIHGVNKSIADCLNLHNCSVLAPVNKIYLLLTIYVPIKSHKAVLEAILAAGAEKMGLYNDCSFQNIELGTLTTKEAAIPNENDMPQTEKEICIKVILEEINKNQVLQAMFTTHPYQTIDYNLIKLENESTEIGSGIIGSLENPIPEDFLLEILTEKFELKIIKHSKYLQKSIQKIAICGGAGSFLIQKAIQKGADCFISSDFKYHDFFEANQQILIVDIGHWESEQFTSNIIIDFLRKKFPTFAPILRLEITNPINYYVKS